MRPAVWGRGVGTGCKWPSMSWSGSGAPGRGANVHQASSHFDSHLSPERGPALSAPPTHTNARGTALPTPRPRGCPASTTPSWLSIATTNGSRGVQCKPQRSPRALYVFHDGPRLYSESARSQSTNQVDSARHLDGPSGQAPTGIIDHDIVKGFWTSRSTRRRPTLHHGHDGFHDIAGHPALPRDSDDLVTRPVDTGD
jgi:hypothetical protein